MLVSLREGRPHLCLSGGAGREPGVASLRRKKGGVVGKGLQNTHPHFPLLELPISGQQMSIGWN